MNSVRFAVARMSGRVAMSSWDMTIPKLYFFTIFATKDNSSLTMIGKHASKNVENFDGKMPFK